MSRHINLVLQGGGVRGLAYVGALESLPPDIELHTVAGTSAGSIVAALLALGRRQADIESMMRNLDLGKLLDAKEQERMARLRWAFASGDESATGLRRMAGLAWRSARLLFRPFLDVGYLAKHRGLYQSEGLKNWLDTIFGDSKFSDIAIQELYVVASDVSLKGFTVFSKAAYPNKRISEAVLASASIPLFFRPVLETDRVLVDGGMLSNFPSHLFERKEYPTVGLRLEGESSKTALGSFGGYVRGLLDTMMDAHDKDRVPHAHFRLFSIDTGDVSSVDFNLTEKQKDFLIESGRRTGRRIPWDLCASSHPVMKFHDDRPNDVLGWSLEQAAAVAKAAEQRSAWCTELHERLFLDYFFDEEWDARLLLKYDYEVRGEVPLFVRRFGLTTPPKGQGMMDLLPRVDCSPPPPDFNVHLIPWAANNERKGFLVVMVPPIAAASGRRGFNIDFSIKDEHREKLRTNGEDSWPLVARRRADVHHFTAVVRFWSAKTLGAAIEVKCPPDWSTSEDMASDSAYDERYVGCGIFTVKQVLSGDVVNTFEFARITRGGEQGRIEGTGAEAASTAEPS